MLNAVVHCMEDVQNQVAPSPRREQRPGRHGHGDVENSCGITSKSEAHVLNNKTQPRVNQYISSLNNKVQATSQG